MKARWDIFEDDNKDQWLARVRDEMGQDQDRFQGGCITYDDIPNYMKAIPSAGFPYLEGFAKRNIEPQAWIKFLSIEDFAKSTQTLLEDDVNSILLEIDSSIIHLFIESLDEIIPILCQENTTIHFRFDSINASLIQTMWDKRSVLKAGSVNFSLKDWESCGIESWKQELDYLETKFKWVYIGTENPNAFEQLDEILLQIQRLKPFQQAKNFASHICIENEVDANVFMQIAKLRTVRLLWSSMYWIEKKNESVPEIDLYSSLSNKTYEFNGLISMSVAALSSCLGNATSFLRPDYERYEKQEAERLARNVVLILGLEGKILDGSLARGSYVIDHITSQMLDHCYEIINTNNVVKEIFESKKPQTDANVLSHFMAGKAPYLRGPYSSMYLNRPWTIRQYAGFSTAQESNQFYKDNLQKGQTGLSVAFDLATHRGFDPDSPRAHGDIGNAGVSIGHVDDMKKLFQGIPLDQMSVSMTMNGAVIPTMAFYIVAAKESGVALSELSGTIQNDILKEYMVRNTYIYDPQTSLRITRDIFQYCSKHMPKFNCISVSGYHMLEAGANPIQELAYTIADGITYVKLGIESGMHVDDFAPRISFFWGIGMNFKEEIAKMRAGRVLWALLMKQFEPQNPKSLMLRTHCQTSGWSLMAEDPQNNITRTCIEAMASISGHTQSLHTNSLDEALALPTKESAAISRNTQKYLQKYGGFTDYVDPWGGSEEIESLTLTYIEQALNIMERIESEGGMEKAIAMGKPQKDIGSESAKRQGLIDTGKEVIIGLNKYAAENYSEIKLRNIANDVVRMRQINELENTKRNRNQSKVEKALKNITKGVSSGENLLKLAVIAAEYRATTGEISDAIEAASTRFQSNIITVSGVYKRFGQGEKLEEAKNRMAKLQDILGNAPKMLVAKIGQDGHDRGARVIASALQDIGFDISVAPMFQTPSEVAQLAIQQNVHLIGISTLVGAHNVLIPELHRCLTEMNRTDIKIVLGGIIPKEDWSNLHKIGVVKIYGPGTNISLVAIDITNYLAQSYSS